MSWYNINQNAVMSSAIGGRLLLKVTRRKIPRMSNPKKPKIMPIGTPTNNIGDYRIKNMPDVLSVR